MTDDDLGARLRASLNRRADGVHADPEGGLAELNDRLHRRAYTRSRVLGVAVVVLLFAGLLAVAFDRSNEASVATRGGALDGDATSSTHGDSNPSSTVDTTTDTSATDDTATVGSGTVVDPATSTSIEDGATTTVTHPATTTTTRPQQLHEPGVEGQVTAGPTCPVEEAGHPCPPQPVSAPVQALDGSGHVVAQTTSDAHGWYAIALSPGSYTIHVVIDGMYPSCADKPATVHAGGPTTVDIDCDTGIR
jgi:cytoskeletal protein RodZ